MLRRWILSSLRGASLNAALETVLSRCGSELRSEGAGSAVRLEFVAAGAEHVAVALSLGVFVEAA
jgi:hypothetical protein